MSGGFFNLPPGWRQHWRGMPEFDQRDLSPYQTIKVHVRCPEDRQRLAEMLGQNLTTPSGRYTESVWFPKAEVRRFADKRFRGDPPLGPTWPVFIPSKGRHETCYTMWAMDKIGIPYRVVVEPQEADAYAAAVGADRLITLPFRDKGLVPTRNWIWDFARDEGHARYWTFDDNICGFYRLHDNLKTPVADGTMFRAMEDFVERYENVAVAGMQYFMFVSRKAAVVPYTLNTRVYSNMLILTDARDPRGRPYRNEGFYNDDTDLCLRVLKDGWCTVLFNAFLIKKSVTMSVGGGMTPHYQGEGRRRMAEELRDKHPDVVKVTRKWGRWQHHVDYRRFQRNRLKPKGPLDALPEVNNYGMYLEQDADRPPLLIGQAPGRKAGGPLEGPLGQKLAKLAGVAYEDYLGRTERLNLLAEFPGKAGKGDAFDPEDAAKAAADLTDHLRGRRVLFLGRAVAKAFGFGKGDLPLMTWKQTRRLRAEVAVIPHPSGVVRWWNDEENRSAARAFLAALLRREESPSRR